MSNLALKYLMPSYLNIFVCSNRMYILLNIYIFKVQQRMCVVWKRFVLFLEFISNKKIPMNEIIVKISILFTLLLKMFSNLDFCKWKLYMLLRKEI